MPLMIKVTPSASLASLRKITEQLASLEAPPLKTMDGLVASALALRHAAHLGRVFEPWVPTLPAKEQAAIKALLGGLTVVSASEGDGCVDDHGGYRAEVRYKLTGSERVVSLHHLLAHDHSAMHTWTSLSLDDQGPSRASKKAPKKLGEQRIFPEAPTNLAPAADQLFAYLGPEAALPRETRIRFLLRLLFPWGRFQRGYHGANRQFYKEADELYTLTPAKRATALAAREHDGEVVPFALD